MRLLRFSMIGFLFVAAASAQQKAVPKRAAKPGIVSGRVFAITQGGDLKPARMAKVYLLYLKTSNAVDPKEHDSAAMAWMHNLNKALAENVGAEQENLDAMQRGETAGWSESLSCRKELLAYQKALVGTLTGASDEHKEWQIDSVDADEDGVFRIAVVRPGRYILLAHGHAGFNDAFWVSEDFTVTLGVETALKLSQPEKACVVDAQ